MKKQTDLEVRLRQLRFEHNEMTQQELANRVGVSRQTIISIEKGRYCPSVDLALRLARELALRVEDIFRLKEDKNG